MKRVSLGTFLRGSSNPKDGMQGCANFDHYYGGCIIGIGNTCLIESGMRCGYFERVVLPTARQLGLADHIYCKYEAKVSLPKGSIPRGTSIGCPDCGETLGFGEKYCRQCTFKRRQRATQDARRRRRIDERPSKMQDMDISPNSAISEDLNGQNGASEQSGAQNQSLWGSSDETKTQENRASKAGS